MSFFSSAAATAAAAAAAAAVASSASSASSPALEHTCGCEACMQMTNSPFSHFVGLAVGGVIIMLIIVGGLFLWGLLFKKFEIW